MRSALHSAVFQQHPRALAAGPLYSAFAATGVGVALPGALLPALLLRWHLHDEQGGFLFLMAWIGSSAGALLVHGSLRRSLVTGCLTITSATFALALCEGHLAALWMALYGAGLGLVMTSISLIRQQQAEQTGGEMVRLNLLWALGACLCPTLTVRALTIGAIRPLLLGLALYFLAVAGWGVFQQDVLLRQHDRQSGGWLRVFHSTPFALILLIFITTGIEASAGGWLATFARRSVTGGPHVVAATVAAPTSLWAGLLLSRLLWSTRFRRFSESTIVRASIALTGVSSVVLVAHPVGWPMLLAAFLLGFGIGPVYPLLVAWALGFRSGGAIFFLAGVGSATLPWLTGLLSSYRNSLQVGMIVPMVGALLMLILAFTSPLHSWCKDRT